jgi:group I intron endonuclease
VCSSDLSFKKHHNCYLQRAWDKYGESNFCFEILEECPVEKLIYWEQIWMDSLCAFDERLGYNICSVAGNSLGTIRTESSKKKMSKAHIGEKSPTAKLTWEEVREIRKKYLTGKFLQKDLAQKFAVSRSNIRSIIDNKSWKDDALTEEYYQTVIAIAKGRQLSKESREKSSLSHRGENSPNAKLNWPQVREIRKKYASGEYTYLALSKEYGINPSNIGKIVNNKHWKE